jgi:hypothetical protein
MAIPLTINNNNNGSPSIDLAVTPTQSPAPTACLECLRLVKILLQNEVSDAKALQDDSSPQFLALRWLAKNDPAVFDLDSMPDVILVERYVLAVLYFANSAEGELDVLNFLSASSVCEWNNGGRGFVLTGAVCNEDDLVVELDLCKSKHEEGIILISKFRIDSPVSLPFFLNRF